MGYNHKKRLAGCVSLAQPLSMHVTMATIVSSFIIVFIFFITSDYSRKETVKGYLVPNLGIIKVYSSKAGVIGNVYVREGDVISKGDVLADVVLFRPKISGIDFSEDILQSLEKQVYFLDQDLINNENIKNKEITGLNKKKGDIKLSISNVENQIKLLKEKHSIKSEEYDKYDKLSKKDFFSNVDLKNKKQELLSIEEYLETTNAKKLSLITQYNDITLKIGLKPYESKLLLTEILRRKEEIKLKINEEKNNYTFSIVARESGLVTAINSKQGEFLPTSRPFLSIIPYGSELIAELYLPTRSAGFVALNNEARLRFDAFPYQRFGFIDSRIVKIDKSLISDGDVDIPIQLSEPVYRVQAKLSLQSISAYGEFFPLKAGMFLEADIILENRTLMQWLLDPIYSLNGRLG